MGCHPHGSLKLCLYDSKTEFIIFQSLRLKQNMSNLSVGVGDTYIKSSSKVRDLNLVLTSLSLFMISLGVIVSFLIFILVI